MNKTEDIMNFKELLGKYEVEIPLIQRDYAQGRPDKETSTKIDSLFNDIFKDISKDNEASLNFIYGRLKDDTFVPLDGQQRLTFLFLLSYYAHVKEKNICGNPEMDTPALDNFHYRMRRSTELFLKRLLSDDKIKFCDNKPSDVIKGAEWFFPQWKRDPTISSMLAVLDKIHDKFKDVNDLQTKIGKISFNFLNVEGLGQAKNFYIRINSRGKPLTEFENFRAELLKNTQRF